MTGIAPLPSGISLLMLLLLLGTGPFGAAIGLLAMLVYAWSSQHAVSPARRIEDFFAGEQDGDDALLYENIVPDAEQYAAQIEPFHDVLSGGTVPQKRVAIARITRYFRPQFAPLLQQALQDANAAVRVQAATSLAKLERDFTLRWMRMEKEGYATGTPAQRLELAHLYDAYANTGLQDRENQQALRAKATGLYESVLAERDEPELRTCLARLYLRRNMPEQSRRMLHAAAQEGTIAPNALPWYVESLVRLREFAQARAVARRYAGALRAVDNFPLLLEASHA